MNGPHGYLKDCLPSGKSESEVRQQRSSLNMLDVIRSAVRIEAKPCPFCGASAPLATKVGPRYVVACMSDDCDAIAQATGSTISEAWDRWNRRAV